MESTEGRFTNSFENKQVMSKKKQIKAAGMLSGGLDSTLAIRVMLEQGIKVTALHFRTGFSYVERSRVAGRGPAMRLGE